MHGKQKNKEKERHAVPSRNRNLRQNLITAHYREAITASDVRDYLGEERDLPGTEFILARECGGRPPQSETSACRCGDSRDASSAASFSHGFAKFQGARRPPLFANICPRPTLPLGLPPQSSPKPELFIPACTIRCKYHFFILFMRFFPPLIHISPSSPPLPRPPRTSTAPIYYAPYLTCCNKDSVIAVRSRELNVTNVNS